MKRAAEEAPLPVSRPTLLDYFLVLLGCGLSLVLIRLGPLGVEAQPVVSGAVWRDLVATLGEPLRLTEGIVLLWPLFFGLQRLQGRSQGLTTGEWLWVVSWLGVAVLTVLAAWGRWGTLPGFFQPHAAKPRLLWYVVFVPSMAALAVVMALIGLVRRRPSPWTHPFSLALVIWPVLPLAVILACGRFR